MADGRRTNGLIVALPRKLEEAIPDASEQERLFWNSLSERKRQLALRRATAFSGWLEGKPPLSAEKAAQIAELSLSRFYRMARDWEDPGHRSLAKLGLGLVRPRRRESSNARAGRKLAFEHAMRLVEADPGDERSVTSLVEELAIILAAEMPEVPGNASLRSTVVEARRRRDAEDTVGVDIAFDISACAMLDEEGELYLLAALVDRGTGIVLGAALPEARTAEECYRPAAADALARLDAGMKTRLPWAPRSENCEVVPLAQEDVRWVERLAAEIPGVNVQLAGRPGRFGRYIRRHVGNGVGALRLLPTLTLSGRPAETSVPKRRYGRAQAEARLAIEVDAHNVRLLESFHRSDAPIPQPLLLLMRTVAGS